MSPMTMPKPSEQAKAAFQRLVPPDSAVTTRPMFGNLSAFVNGNMFCGLFGDDLFVRVSDDDQAKVRKQGGRPFEVMPGRAMTGYVMLPGGWQKKTDTARDWILVALAFSKKLPAKASKAKTAASKKAPSGKKPAGRSAR
jgi:TfoX/Sxy family transcriptional regulator of competence genes